MAATPPHLFDGGAGSGGPAPVRRLRFDVGERPFLVLFELTRACELACRHCRADSQARRDPDELDTDEVRRVLDDLALLGAPRPRVVFTGGDPLQRPDLDSLVAHGSRAGLAVAVSPAGTPRAERARLAGLRLAGAGAVSFSIDGADAVAHDRFRGVEGSFDWTVEGCRGAVETGLRLQVNSTMSTETVSELPRLARLVAALGASLWSVFFLVPVGRGSLEQALSVTATEDVLAFLHDVAEWMPLKTTEAPAFRRVAVERGRGVVTHHPGPLYRELRQELDAVWPETDRRAVPGNAGRPPGTGPRRSPLAVGDGRGVVFVSCVGDVQPSGFLPLVAGNVRHSPLTEIYPGSSLLQSLRDPMARAGRCGRCEMTELCGGSRAQAFARLGDPLGEDPTCGFVPPAAAVVRGQPLRTA